MDFTCLGIQICICLSQIHKKKVSETSQYLVWPLFASCSATHLLRIELIRLLIVACGMLFHFSSMAVRSCWILAGTGTQCRTRQSRATWVTCLVSMQAMEELGHFQLPGIVYRSLQHGAVHYHAETRGDGGWRITRQWASGLITVYLCAFKLPSIKCKRVCYL